MSKSLYLLMILFLVAVMSGCDEGEDISDPNEVSTYSVKMGGIFPFTGALSDKGKPRHHAALLAVKHLTEAGFPVKWVVADSRSDAATGVKAASDLIEKEQVDVLIGAASSNVTIAIVQQISIPNKVPQISFSSTSPQITELEADKGQDFLFRTVSSDTLQGIVAAKLALGGYPSYLNKTYQRISTLYVENPYGKGINNSFKKNFEKEGTVIADVPHGEERGSDVEKGGNYLSELQLAAKMDWSEEQRPQALVAMSYKGHAVSYLRQAIDNKFFDEFIFVDGTRSDDIIKAVPELNGMCGTAHGWEESESRENFKAAYKEEYGEFPEVSYQSNSYDAVIIAGLAAYAAQAMGEEITPLTIRKHISRVAGRQNVENSGEKVGTGHAELKRAMKILDSGLTINYEGASGNVDFDENGDVIAPIEIWCFEGGKIVHKENVPSS